GTREGDRPDALSSSRPPVVSKARAAPSPRAGLGGPPARCPLRALAWHRDTGCRALLERGQRSTDNCPLSRPSLPSLTRDLVAGSERRLAPGSTRLPGVWAQILSPSLTPPP